jgi:hypothetical protein
MQLQIPDDGKLQASVALALLDKAMYFSARINESPDNKNVELWKLLCKQLQSLHHQIVMAWEKPGEVDTFREST